MSDAGGALEPSVFSPRVSNASPSLALFDSSFDSFVEPLIPFVLAFDFL